MKRSTAEKLIEAATKTFGVEGKQQIRKFLTNNEGGFCYVGGILFQYYDRDVDKLDEAIYWNDLREYTQDQSLSDTEIESIVRWNDENLNWDDINNNIKKDLMKS